ncbi:MAG: CDP-glucose 4,6-dehydratase [Marinifilaceae bacterium]|jgi:CDP-glucose 4,6-dehydratase|nr:CDP-glucose 4,6-dehydratase [Marinifilaceae bacterium]
MNYKNKKVLITGHTGFKGTWLTTWMLNLGADVYGISKDIPTNPSMFEELKLEEKITHHIEDIRNLDRMKSIIGDVKPDFIFHLAAQPIVSTSYSDPIETLSSNIMGTANILEVLRLENFPCTAIFITSDKCYDNVEWVWGYKETDAVGGKDIYSGSKGGAELVFKSYFNSFFNNEESNVRLASARAGNVIGGGDWALDRIVPDCMRAWSENKTVEIRCPDATRPWQHVLEPLSGYIDLAYELSQNKALHGESFNFGPNAEYNHTVKDLLEDLSKTWKYDDASDAYEVTGNIKFHEAGLLKLNCDKALFHLKWVSTMNYNQLLDFTGSWYYEYYNNKSHDMFDFTVKQINDYTKFAIKKGIKWAK